MVPDAPPVCPTRPRTLAAGLAVTAALALAACLSRDAAGLGAREPLDPAAAALRFPYCDAPSCARGVRFDLGDVTRAWVDWRNAHICDATSGGPDIPAAPSCASSDVCGDAAALRVWKTDSKTTVDEGLGYGAYLAMLFDEQRVLDGIFRFARRPAHLTADGLTHWQIGRCDEVVGAGASTDGELDLTLALAAACVKVERGAWPPSPRGVAYCDEAVAMVDRLWASVVDHPGAGLDAHGAPDGGLAASPGYELLPGDQWTLPADFPRGIVNLSYFDPGALRALDRFRRARLPTPPVTMDWDAVIDRQLELIEVAQSDPASCSGLVPQWSDYAGRCQTVPWQGPVESCAFSFDAGRVAWRQSRSATWYPDALARSAAAVDRLAGFFGSVGLARVAGAYGRDGVLLHDKGASFFVANAAMAVWAADRPSPVPASCGASTGRLVDAGPSGRAAAWEATRTTLEPSVPHRYFNHALRLFGLLLMSGNDPDLLARAASSPGGVEPGVGAPPR